MKEAKALNLDAFAPPVRSVTIKNHTYPIKEFTVKDYVAAMRQADEIEKEGNAERGMEKVIQAVQQAVPSMPADVLDDLHAEQLVVLFRFIQGEIPTDMQEEQAEAEQAEGATEGKQTPDL